MRKFEQPDRSFPVIFTGYRAYVKEEARKIDVQFYTEIPKKILRISHTFDVEGMDRGDFVRGLNDMLDSFAKLIRTGGLNVETVTSVRDEKVQEALKRFRVQNPIWEKLITTDLSEFDYQNK